MKENAFIIDLFKNFHGFENLSLCSCSSMVCVCACKHACVRACVRVSGDEFENSLTLWVYYGPVIYERSDAYYEY